MQTPPSPKTTSASTWEADNLLEIFGFWLRGRAAYEADIHCRLRFDLAIT